MVLDKAVMFKPKVNIDSKDNLETYFLEVYGQYKRKVLNTALGLVQHLPDAEEITQDVFVTVYFELENFKGKSSIGTWIYRITVNKSLDFLKSKKRKKRFAWLTSLFDPESGEELHIIPEFNHPGVQLENKEDVTILFQHVNQLPDKQKTALILSVIEQLSYEEISKIMEISLSAVESLIFRARQNLKKDIGGYLLKPALAPQVKYTTSV